MHAVRTWYDRTGRSKNAVRTQICLSLYFFRLFLAFCSRLPATLYIFWSPYGRRMVAVRSDGGIRGATLLIVFRPKECYLQCCTPWPYLALKPTLGIELI